MTDNIHNYSAAELRLIACFGYGHLIDDISPMPLYRMMMEKAFIEDRKGDAAESLRRCMQVLSSGKVFRNTPEWDDLITV